MMDVTLRAGRPDDAPVVGQICYDAFCAIADQHNYPHDFPSADVAGGLVSYLLGHAGFYSVVAERDGQVVGSNFLDERSQIAGVGPITVDPSGQNQGVGRRLMQAVLDRAAERGVPGVRLVQAGYHARSFSLYTSLGFESRELLACVNGPAISETIPGRTVRQAQAEDLGACNRVCRVVHGHNRTGDLQEAIAAGIASVVEHDGRITGYATSVTFFGHAVGETDDDLKALIAAAPTFEGPGFLVPARSPMLRWCLEKNLRVVQLMTLMSTGLYNEPKGAFLPSILY